MKIDKVPYSKKVCLLSDHHICMNPRLWKEAFFYEKLGFDVIIITMWQSEQLLLKDKEILKGHSILYEPYLNLIVWQINPLSRFFYRLRKRLGNELQKHFNIGTGWAISHAPEKMFKKAITINADLYSAHLECAFFVGRELLKAGKKVSFDFEDWYSHDYLVPERPVKLLEQIEKYALENGLFCTAASSSMANALKNYYNVNNEITVIYNGFPKDEAINFNAYKSFEENAIAPLKLLWFSRTIGPDRGIEFLLNALKDCQLPIELHLLGDMAKGYNQFLENIFPYNKGHLLKIHAFMQHSKLLGFLAQFKIGLAIEENVNDNKQLTITNKILQYLQAGLLVIASNTKGQREVAEYFSESVKIVDLNDKQSIVNAIKLYSKKEKINQQNQFESIFSWEAQEEKLLKIIVQYL